MFTHLVARRAADENPVREIKRPRVNEVGLPYSITEGSNTESAGALTTGDFCAAAAGTPLRFTKFGNRTSLAVRFAD